MLIDGVRLTDTTYEHLVKQIKKEGENVNHVLSILGSNRSVIERVPKDTVWQEQTIVVERTTFIVSAFFDFSWYEYELIPNDKGVIGHKITG